MEKMKYEAGMYGEAATTGKAFGAWLEDYHVEKGMEPTPYQGLGNFDRIQLKKTLQAQGKEVPPDAYEVALKMHGIKAFGSQTDQVGKFFANADAAALFPEFISRQIYASALRMSLIPQMVAERVTIPGFEYKKIYLEDTEKDRVLTVGGRNDTAPQLKVTVGAQSVNIHRFWRSFLLDYQAIYNTPLNLYGTVLNRIGQQVGISETDDFIYTLLNGDGNSNGLDAGYVVETLATTAISKRDIINFASELDLPYRVNVFVGKKNYMQVFWDTLSDMTNPPSQWAATSIPMRAGYVWDR